MRLLKTLTLATIVALLVAGAASASVRGGLASVATSARHVLAATTDPSPSASPSAEASAEPSAEPTPDSAPAAVDRETPHAEAVSAVARDHDAVATWVNPAGKEITNHGQAVRAAAHAKAGGEGHGGGRSSGAGKGKD